ncbi:membrane protein [Ensifer adhaerens]|uniref:Membrane protein n=1 Tax=Ensifer adhaerens TaxID=106592 RepID=A0A0L8BV00_ENSAD|nr:DUF6766 family protein [Ensifer adhaerens]KOF18413.1 membrane protein [Ensifer adhaerens]
MRFLRDNGLTIVLVTATLITLMGMYIAGWLANNDELTAHGSAPLTLAHYGLTGHFLSAVFENWESEFLQMSAYVVLTAYLYQRGSAESKDPDKRSPQDEELAAREEDPEAPWPVKAGGVVRFLYAYSLGIVLTGLFLASFVLHLFSSARAESETSHLHGQPTTTFVQHLGSAQFWFESLQNWQSEFLSTAVIVVLSIFLRYRGSPESKPVGAHHRGTGS